MKWNPKSICLYMELNTATGHFWRLLNQEMPQQPWLQNFRDERQLQQSVRQFCVHPQCPVYMQSGGAVIYMRDLSIMMYQVRPLVDDLVVRYVFLDQSAADYVGMALYYQQYLAERFGLKRMDETEIPLLLELIGGIEKVEPVFGVSQKVVKPVTMFEQAESIVGHFLDQGVKNLVIRYNGWLKRGMEHIFPSGVKLEPKLGRSSSLRLWQQLEGQQCGALSQCQFSACVQNNSV